MRRYLAILAMAALVGCSGGGDKTTDTGATAGDDDDDAACTNSVVATFPEADDTDVYYKTNVRFTLGTEDTAATLAITDAGGVEVPGTSTVAGTMVSWDGSADLAPSTSYTATLNYECGTTSVAFTTSSTGTPTEVDITDNVYELDLASGEWIEPAEVGDLIASQVGAVQVLVSPKVVAATEITMIGALGDGVGNQDVCLPSLDFGQAAAWSDPYFELSSPVLGLDISGFVVNVEDVVLSGAFAPDGSRIQGAFLQGSINTMGLGEVFGAGTEDGAVCELVLAFGIPCEECSDGSGPYCLSIAVENIQAGLLPSSPPLEVIVQADIDANPSCGG